MKIWKYNQIQYHLLYDPKDYIENKKTKISQNLIEDIIDYFNIDNEFLIYPAKSYAVGIIYAQLLHDHYGENFYMMLDDPTLLYGNDKYFVRYSKDKYVYDSVLTEIDLSFKRKTTQVDTTLYYGLKEFDIIK